MLTEDGGFEIGSRDATSDSNSTAERSPRRDTLLECALLAASLITATLILTAGSWAH